MGDLSTLSTIVLAAGVSAFFLILIVFLVWIFVYDRRKPAPSQLDRVDQMSCRAQPHKMPPMQVPTNRASEVITAAPNVDYSYISNETAANSSSQLGAQIADNDGKQVDQMVVPPPEVDANNTTSTFQGQAQIARSAAQEQGAVVTDTNPVALNSYISMLSGGPAELPDVYSVGDSNVRISAADPGDQITPYDNPVLASAPSDNNNEQKESTTTPYDLAASPGDGDVGANASAVVDEAFGEAHAAADAGDYFILEREEDVGDGRQRAGTMLDTAETCYDLARQ